MKKGTLLGIIISVLCIIVLAGLGVLLMLDAQGILPMENLIVSARQEPPQSPAQTAVPVETETETETNAAAEAEKIDVQTAAALTAAQTANASSDLPEHLFIFVGDSRTLGMGNAEKEQNDPCIYIGATGEGYNWFIEEGLAQMEEAMALYPDAPVILNLGVNDPDMIDHYLELYASFGENYPGHIFYYMSVNPVTEESIHVTNTEISDFNARLRDMFPDQYLDCNTYLRIREFESVDGVHYTEDTYRVIHDFAVSQLLQKSNTP